LFIFICLQLWTAGFTPSSGRSKFPLDIN
jgi:hypothetical protein